MRISFLPKEEQRSGPRDDDTVDHIHIHRTSFSIFRCKWSQRIILLVRKLRTERGSDLSMVTEPANRAFPDPYPTNVPSALILGYYKKSL